MAEHHPIVSDGKVKNLLSSKCLMNFAVSPERNAQERDEERRSVPTADAMDEHAVASGVAEAVQHGFEIILSDGDGVPIGDRSVPVAQRTRGSVDGRPSAPIEVERFGKLRFARIKVFEEFYARIWQYKQRKVRITLVRIVLFA